ncbi:2Fe-2S iron-sulfur cluster-binding protein [Rhodococcus sp. T7]|jgi:2Fe-2S ferredoxin|uniref:2Fe-2S iron-sulfur cluster-binding protein n=1 Tax=Rhodococcus sp. T7 TaxID=627444 RepID=UPI001357469E|nr:2Fe-2S iron-sulfur cluster-binding protein [Rhodococcus sp. T7]KAF0960332.1 Ferredoxin-6 [Rhodococcus sp. T7]
MTDIRRADVLDPEAPDTADPRIVVIDRDGEHHRLDWEPDQSLMEVLRDNGLPILASCGGTASCATCHVFLDPQVTAELGERCEDEQELLEETESFDTARSRLSCQVERSTALDGITVTLAPEE